MSEHELEKLLGGFAADTLTQQEREALFRAALQDQQLFNALADEQALKEVLTDPAVRRRLLQALDRQAAPRSTSWLDRLTTRAAVTWAGAVALGLFAVVLGLRVYEESLRQASETAVVEDEGPPVPSKAPRAAPPAHAPVKEAEKKEPRPAPKLEPAKKDNIGSALSSREQRAASGPREGPPVAALGKPSQPPASSSDQPSPQPSSPASEMALHAPAQTGVKAAAGASARALFLGHRPEIGLRGLEKEREVPGTTERFGLRKTLDTTATATPLALRYTFNIPANEGSEHDVKAGRTGERPVSVTLSVESNQDAYIQIWRKSGEALPELLLPAKDTGRISLKTAAGQRQQVKVEGETDRLIVRLSRVPFGPITRQEAVMAGRGADGQLTESVSSMEETATYVANPDASATELAAEIPLEAYVRR